MLAEHPIEAGLPPRFEVLDEVRQSLTWQSEWERMVDLLATDDAGGRIFEVASLLGLKTRRLEDLARTVATEWDACQEVRPDLDRIVEDVARIVERARQRIAEALERAAGARRLLGRDRPSVPGLRPRGGARSPHPIEQRLA